MLNWKPKHDEDHFSTLLRHVVYLQRTTICFLLELQIMLEGTQDANLSTEFSSESQLDSSQILSISIFPHLQSEGEKMKVVTIVSHLPGWFTRKETKQN